VKVGLFFGSFNPIHNGHLSIAHLLVETSKVDQVWFIISPQNPFKSIASLADEKDRYTMVVSAIQKSPLFSASDVEFSMSKPSYTINTLASLANSYPKHEFFLIVGEDNLLNFSEWKDYKIILEQYGLFVYPRPVTSKPLLADHTSVHWLDEPIINISATGIRKSIKQGKSVEHLLPDSVVQIIKLRKLYL